MNQNIIMTLLFILGVISLSAKTIATIDGENISEAMLQKRVAKFENTDFSYSEIKKIALQELIQEQLLINYAKREKIDVDEIELDAYFINELGDHPNFVVNGEFNDTKYQNFKFTARGKRILKEMRRDILLSKTKTLIIKDLNLTDKYLYQKFLIENTKIEINYAIVDIDKVNIPLHYSVEGAIKYYQQNKGDFLSDKLVNLEFLYFPKERYKELAIESYTYDSTKKDTSEMMQIEDEADRLAREKATITLKQLKAGDEISEQIFQSGFLSENDEFGIIDNSIIREAFSRKTRDFSPIKEVPGGYLIYQIHKIKRPQKAKLADIKDKVWDSYIKDEKVKNQREYEKVFIANIDEFILPATIVKKIVIGKPSYFTKKSTEAYQQDLAKQIWEFLYNEKKLEMIIKQNHLKTTNSTIYLDKIENSADEDNLIARKLNNGDESGSFYKDGNLIIFKSTLHFPEYIPKIEDAISRLEVIINDTNYDSSDLEEYYKAHQKNFVTPDSLKLGICHFEKSLKNFQVSDEELRHYYQTNNFYREEAVNFDYIYTNNKVRADLIFNLCQTKINFKLLKQIYSDNCALASNIIIEYKELPSTLQNEIFALENSTYSSPLNYKNGWLIVFKNKDYAAGIPLFSELKDEITKELHDKQAELNAYQKAKALFDSTRYFSQAYKFTNSKNIYKTEFQKADDNFPYLDNIATHRKELLRIWPNEKYSSIIDSGDEFAVIYLLKKKSSKQLNFESAKDEIKKVLLAQKQIQKANNYTQRIANRINNSGKPEHLLYFLGGWNHIAIDSIDEDIFSSKFSKLIINDISTHEEGYSSPVIKLENNRFLFYQIDKMKKVTLKGFNNQKGKYKQKIIKAELKKWYNKQKSKSEIKY
ncbi:MAG: peptidyl-prolyl cis-trans isomerase [Candidatus Cloacimonetes bacterium]|nr:peptidyl-prolyl cis-trans isomerase [Candidatus Cloacimonadota bacterium]